MNVYVAAIKWGQTGQLLLKNLYTTQTYSNILFYPVYTVVGLAFASVNPFLLFQVLSAVCGVLLFVGIYLFAWIFIKDRWLALLATVLTALGGGLGWLFFPNIPSADLLITSFTFQSAWQRPHEAIGMMWYFCSLYLFYYYFSTKKIIYSFLSLACLLVLVVFYPYYLATYGLILGSFLYLHKDTAKNIYDFSLLGLNIILTLFITVFYFDYLVSGGFAGVAGQTLSRPPLVSLFLGYGLFMPIVIYQLTRWKTILPDRRFLLIWVFVSLSLSFLPIGITRFYLRGLFLPLSILVVFALKELKINSPVKLSLAIVVILFLSLPSSLYIFYRRVKETRTINPWYYQPRAADEMFDYLQMTNKDGVLAGYTLGNYLPAHTGKSVYFGHLIQTPQATEKLYNLEIFYQGKLQKKEALQFLRYNKINFVVYGHEEKQWGKLKYPFLHQVFSSKEIVLYEVVGK